MTRSSQPVKVNNFIKAYAGDQHWHEHAANTAMVEEIQRQLQEMHGLRYVPKPYAAAYQDWSGDPYGGGVNFWKMHEKSWEVIPAILQPKADVPVYICGEAYSNGQGWVEGALETAEMVLQQKFGLPSPSWVWLIHEMLLGARISTWAAPIKVLVHSVAKHPLAKLLRKA